MGRVEYAYWRMARAAGVEMSECRLLEEHGRRHFMTRRFDRPDNGDKLHMQTLGALEHVSYNEPGTYSYEQALLLVRRIGLAHASRSSSCSVGWSSTSWRATRTTTSRTSPS